MGKVMERGGTYCSAYCLLSLVSFWDSSPISCILFLPLPQSFGGCRKPWLAPILFSQFSPCPCSLSQFAIPTTLWPEGFIHSFLNCFLNLRFERSSGICFFLKGLFSSLNLYCNDPFTQYIHVQLAQHIHFQQLFFSKKFKVTQFLCSILYQFGAFVSL